MSETHHEFGGSKRLADGSRVLLAPDEARAIWESIQVHQAARAQKLPDEQSAICAMFEAFERLREFGWQDAIYCPKDGTEFQVIEAGSTGIHPCIYQGEWPNGGWWIVEDGDMSPSRPVLFKLYPKDEKERKRRMSSARAKFMMIERLARWNSPTTR